LSSVLDDHLDLAVLPSHRAFGEVFETHHEPGLGLLGIGFERAGLAGDQCDLEVGRGHRRRHENPERSSGQSDWKTHQLFPPIDLFSPHLSRPEEIMSRSMRRFPRGAER
jgi:hypothetical protein